MNYVGAFIAIVLTFSLSAQDDVSYTLRYYSGDNESTYEVYSSREDKVYVEWMDSLLGEWVVASLEVNSYDEHGRIIANFSASKHLDGIDIEFHFYSKDSTLHQVFNYSVEVSHISNEGTISILKDFYKRKALNSLMYMEGSERQMTKEEKYDSIGRVIFRAYYSEGLITSLVTTNYDNEQTTLTRKHFYNESLLFTSFVTFNDNGKIESLAAIDDGDTSETVYNVYDSNGNLTESKRVNEWAERVNKNTYEWHETTNQYLNVKTVISNQGIKEREFNYTYDERGHMTSLVEKSVGNEDDDDFRWEYTYFD